MLGFIIFMLLIAALAAFIVYKTNEEFRVAVTAAIAAGVTVLASWWEVIEGWFGVVSGWFS